MIAVNFPEQKRRVDIRQIDLTAAFEVAFGAVEILRHHAEFDISRAEHVAHLAEHFLHAHVAAGVARAVVARKEQLQLFARGPALAETEHPAEAPEFDQRADPCYE